MVLKRKDGDLCSSYRPCSFSDVVGQQTVVKSLRSSILSPSRAHCFLLHGESGCGKTTLARILAMALNCTNLEANGDPCCECQSCKSIMQDSHPDIKEVNAADAGGKDEVRKIQSDLRTAPMFGNNKVFILDEAHRMTVHAQDALLKGTEDMPEGVYVILCSTEPTKLLKTLRGRCEEHHIKKLTKPDLKNLVETVGAFENFYPSEKIITAVLSVSEGRPRNALRALQKAISLSSSTEEEVLDSLSFIDIENPEVFELCKMFSQKLVSWEKLVSLYKNMDVGAEEIRLSLAGWFRVSLEKGISFSDKNAQLLDLFIDPLPVIKPENGLVLRLYKAFKICQNQRL